MTTTSPAAASVRPGPARRRAAGPGQGRTTVCQPCAANGAAVSRAPVRSSAITQKRSRGGMDSGHCIKSG